MLHTLRLFGDGVTFYLRSRCCFLWCEVIDHAAHPIPAEFFWGRGYYLLTIQVEDMCSCYDVNPKVQEIGLVISMSVCFV